MILGSDHERANDVANGSPQLTGAVPHAGSKRMSLVGSMCMSKAWKAGESLSSISFPCHVISDGCVCKVCFDSIVTTDRRVTDYPCRRCVIGKKLKVRTIPRNLQ
jgi:hypothetical protein